MATTHADLTETGATNLTDDLSLTDGMTYSCQVLGGTVRLVEIADAADLDITDATARATAEGNAFRYHAEQHFTLRAVTGQEIFAWSEGGSARVVVSTGFS